MCVHVLYEVCVCASVLCCVCVGRGVWEGGTCVDVCACVRAYTFRINKCIRLMNVSL